MVQSWYNPAFHGPRAVCVWPWSAGGMIKWSGLDSHLEHPQQSKHHLTGLEAYLLWQNRRKNITHRGRLLESRAASQHVPLLEVRDKRLDPVSQLILFSVCAWCHYRSETTTFLWMIRRKNTRPSCPWGRTTEPGNHWPLRGCAGDTGLGHEDSSSVDLKKDSYLTALHQFLVWRRNN